MILCLVLISSSVHSETILNQNATTAEKSFEFNDFGLPPSPHMTCVKGPCLDSDAEEIYKQSRTIVSSYFKPIDVTHFGGVPISSPRYDYFNDENFQILFEIVCDYENMEACMDQVESNLIETYGMENLESANIVQSEKNEIIVRDLGMDSGILARIIRMKVNNVWGNPAVKIYRKDLIDKLRSAVNPHYVSKKFN